MNTDSHSKQPQKSHESSFQKVPHPQALPVFQAFPGSFMPDSMRQNFSYPVPPFPHMIHQFHPREFPRTILQPPMREVQFSQQPPDIDFSLLSDSRNPPVGNTFQNRFRHMPFQNEFLIQEQPFDFGAPKFVPEIKEESRMEIKSRPMEGRMFQPNFQAFQSWPVDPSHHQLQGSVFLDPQVQAPQIPQQITAIKPVEKVPQIRRVHARIIDGKLWTDEDDAMLRMLAKQHKSDWKKVMRKFKLKNKTLTTNFLKTRYKELIMVPVHRRTKFTHFEDLLIVKLIEKYGMQWDAICKHFKDRTNVMIKNRYYSFIRHNTRYDELKKELEEKEKEDAIEKFIPNREPEVFEVLVDEKNQIILEPERQKETKTITSPQAPIQDPTILMNTIETQKKLPSENNLSITQPSTDISSAEHDYLKNRLVFLEKIFNEAQTEIARIKQTLK